MIKISNCPRCGRKEVKITKGECHNCYRRFIWNRKKVECKHCKKIKIMQAKGYCSNCYNKLFKYDAIMRHMYKKRYNIDLETHRRITAKCIICGFDKIVDLHHLDRDHKNNDPSNLAGLCPNHHKMSHMYAYKDEIAAILREKGFENAK